jgi:hypothetical protein
MSTSIQNMWRITIIWYATDKLSKLLIKWPSATDSPRIGLTPLWKTSLILLSLWHFHFWKQSSRGENAIRRAIFPVPSCYGMPWLYWFGVKLFTVALLSLVDIPSSLCFSLTDVRTYVCMSHMWFLFNKFTLSKSFEIDTPGQVQ